MHGDPQSPLGVSKAGLGPKVPGVGAGWLEQHQPRCWGLARPAGSSTGSPRSVQGSADRAGSSSLTLGARQCPQPRPEAGTALGQGLPSQSQTAEERGWHPWPGGLSAAGGRWGRCGVRPGRAPALPEPLLTSGAVSGWCFHRECGWSLPGLPSSRISRSCWPTMTRSSSATSPR